ncbi:MAG: terminase small subunit [Planctomycetota bacterium]
MSFLCKFFVSWFVSAKLTAKQRRFYEEYVVDLNATQAAIRAGYGRKTAREIGRQNLTKLDIQQYVQRLMEERSARTEITADQVLRQLAAIAFASITGYLSFRLEGYIAAYKAANQARAEEAMLIKARAHARLGQIEQAIESCSTVAGSPGTNQAAEAGLLTGYCHMLQGKPKENPDSLPALNPTR